MVDGEKTLVSLRVGDSFDPRGETAIWGSSEVNSLVVVLRTLLT